MGQATGEKKIWRIHTACWMTKATAAHSEYVVRIDFPRQQWLRERASLILYTYIDCLVTFTFPKMKQKRYNYTAYRHLLSDYFLLRRVRYLFTHIYMHDRQ